MPNAVAAIAVARPSHANVDHDAKLQRLYAQWQESYIDFHQAMLAMKEVPSGDPRMEMMELALGKANSACARLEFQVAAVPTQTLEGLRIKGTVEALRYDGDKEDAVRHLRESIDRRDDGDAFLASLILDLADWDFLANPQGKAAT
ncbi:MULTISPECIES: hypothetical protein [unclassified Beijerinckia]|uniref:hypothetical protein n=1 Tax=unclassified Beijerinckia TaxID=2638183 RepID=UPI00089B7848|nr:MULTISPECIES: hypothetical protein [unclassified Beijerinckia]MDH7797489.1 hypothetical protein [Beijerinckia sp. GAS462]SEC87686.1 hypothetical protein SAMN05443249_3784 [Beijerinckia sp. 28-YEA-48]